MTCDPRCSSAPYPCVDAESMIYGMLNLFSAVCSCATTARWPSSDIVSPDIRHAIVVETALRCLHTSLTIYFHIILRSLEADIENMQS